MVLILSLPHQVLAGAILGEVAEAVAEIPTARPLAKVAANGAEALDLLASDTAGCLHQRGIVPLGHRMVDQLRQGGQGSQAQAGGGDVVDPLEFPDALNVHHSLGGRAESFQETEEVGAAG